MVSRRDSQKLSKASKRAQEHSRTVLAPIVSVGIDLLAQDLHVFPRGSAVQLIDPHLLPAHVVAGVVLDVEPEVS